MKKIFHARNGNVRIARQGVGGESLPLGLVQARAALEPLRGQSENGALLSRVSQILRHYVAAAFDLPPGELTTVEFCGAIASHTRGGGPPR